MEKLARRALWRRAAALSATLAVAVGNPTLFARPCGPYLDFPTEPRDRLAVASYPFRAFIERPGARSRDRKQPGMDLEEFAGMVVKRFNVRNIEPLSTRSEEHTSELQSQSNLVCRLLLEKKKNNKKTVQRQYEI